MPTTPVQADDDTGTDDIQAGRTVNNNGQMGTPVLENRMDEQKKVRFEKDVERRRNIYRRCRSEDPTCRHDPSLKPNLRVSVWRQKSIHDEEISTPLLDSDEDGKEDNRLPKLSFEPNDEYDGGKRTPVTPDVRPTRRRKVPKPRHVVLTIVLMVVIVAIVVLFIKISNKGDTEERECQTFEAYLNEEVIKTETKKGEYYLPWKFSNDTSPSLTRIKCNERDFVALQTGRYTINVKIHVNTHRWIGEGDLERQFPVKLCIRVGSDTGFQDRYCSVKIQLSREVGAVSLNHMLQLEEGEKFRLLLRTDEELRNIIGSSQPKINKVQIHKENCRLKF